MIIDFNRYNGGGGSGSGSTDLTNYWNSAQTESAITVAVEPKADKKILVDFDRTPQADRATLYATLKALYDGGSGATINKDYDFFKTVGPKQGLKIDYYTFSGGTAVFGKVVSPDNISDQVVYGQVLTIDSAGTVNVVTNTVGGGASGETNSNILAAITTQAEYEAISGSVKTEDLIQVYGVDINDDGEPEYGLFANVCEGEICWERRDNADSIKWADRDYPWMADNDVFPIYLGQNSFLISEGDGEYNGIGFDRDGNPVITRIVPEYDDQTGEVTGMTREDTPIGGGLPVGYEAADQYSIGENFQIVTVDGKVFGEDLYDIPAFHTFEDGYSDEERGYVIGNWCYVYGYFDGDDNFVPVFLPAGTYAILNTDDNLDNYGKVLNLFYGKVGDEDVIYNGDGWVHQLDSISLKSPLFTITEPTCPTTEDNYYELYLDYTDKPSAQSQIDTLDEVVSAALVDLNEKKVESEDIKHMVKLTQADYDQLVLDDEVDPETFYIIVNNSL